MKYQWNIKVINRCPLGAKLISVQSFRKSIQHVSLGQSGELTDALDSSPSALQLWLKPIPILCCSFCLARHFDINESTQKC